MDKNVRKNRSVANYYVAITLLVVIIGLPLYSQAIALAALGLAEFSYLRDLPLVGAITAGTLFYLAIGGVGYLYGRFMPDPMSSKKRYLPFVIPILYIFMLWLIVMAVSQGNMNSYAFNNIFPLALLPFVGVGVVALFSANWYIMPIFAISVYSVFLLFSLWASHRRGHDLLLTTRKITVSCTLFIVLTAIAIYQWHSERDWILTDSGDTPKLNEEIDLTKYRPFGGSNTLVPLRGKPTLSISENYPKIDGATAAYPVYAAAVNALYQGNETISKEQLLSYVSVSKTPVAYQRLIDGEVDIIIVAQPSQKQREEADRQGVALELTPIAKEAFVFVTNKHNPVQSLTVKQIRDIYAGKINDWGKVGGDKGEIIAFQRPAGSGSQTAIEANVMMYQPMRKPRQTENVSGMGGINYGVANYTNYPNALGYSFRFYTTQMNQHPDIRLLSVDGIAPTPENIRNGSYPFTVDVYAVTSVNPTDNTRKLLNWMLSEQGQQLIDDVGYVSLLQVDSQ